MPLVGLGTTLIWGSAQLTSLNPGVWLLSVLGGADLIFQGPWLLVDPRRCLTPCFPFHTVLGTGTLSQLKRGAMV